MHKLAPSTYSRNKVNVSALPATHGPYLVPRKSGFLAVDSGGLNSKSFTDFLSLPPSLPPLSSPSLEQIKLISPVSQSHGDSKYEKALRPWSAPSKRLLSFLPCVLSVDEEDKTGLWAWADSRWNGHLAPLSYSEWRETAGTWNILGGCWRTWPGITPGMASAG